MSADEFEALLDELVTAGVLSERDDEAEHLGLTERFVNERETQRAGLGDSGDEIERFASSLGVEPAELDRETVADALAIQELAPAVDDRQAILAADVVDRFTDEVLGAGVPKGFVSVRPDEVATFVEQHDGAVVYFWGDDCEPCDRMHEEFSGLVERDMVPDELELGAVYLGAEADIDDETVDLIADEWMVTIVPTTLFFLEGGIDARYYGWKPMSALKQELDILAGYVTGEDLTLDPEDVDEEFPPDEPRADDAEFAADEPRAEVDPTAAGEPATTGGEPAEPAPDAGDVPPEPAPDAGDVPGDDESITPNVAENTSSREVEEMTAPPSAIDDAGGEYEDVRKVAESFTDIREYIEGMTAEEANITFERSDAEELTEALEGIEQPDALWQPDSDGPADGRPDQSKQADGEDSVDHSESADRTGTSVESDTTDGAEPADES